MIFFRITDYFLPTNSSHVRLRLFFVSLLRAVQRRRFQTAGVRPDRGLRYGRDRDQRRERQVARPVLDPRQTIRMRQSVRVVRRQEGNDSGRRHPRTHLQFYERGLFMRGGRHRQPVLERSTDIFD